MPQLVHYAKKYVLPKLRCYNAMCNRPRTITQIRDCALCKLDGDEYVSAENPCRRETVVLNRSEARVEQFSYSLLPTHRAAQMEFFSFTTRTVQRRPRVCGKRDEN